MGHSAALTGLVLLTGWGSSVGAADERALSPELLFICRDAGETLAFLPVLQILNANHSGSAPRAVALAATLNAQQRLAALPAPAVLSWERLGLPGASSQRFLDRNATLPPASLAALLARLRPGAVVTGLVSSIQMQLASAWVGSGRRRVIGYDDGFGVQTWVPGGPALSQQFVLRGAVTELLVAAELIAAQARNFSRSVARRELRVVTVGQPTLESWRAVAADRAAARRLRARLLGSSERPVCLFFGGYGPGYNDSVRLLASSLVAGGPLSEYDCLLTPHPGQGGKGQLEQAIFTAMVSRHNIADLWVAFFSRCQRYRCGQARKEWRMQLSTAATATRTHTRCRS